MSESIIPDRDVTWIVPGELRIPNYIWNLLYGYQKESIFWFYHLHKNQVGGIL